MPKNSATLLLTPYCAEDELNCCILLLDQVQANGNGRLPDHDCPDMVSNTDWRNLGSVEEFEDVHRDQPGRLLTNVSSEK